ncbi:MULTISPECIES: MurR/RpiR family transcriptional regulator [Rhodomicrobium]|uniref:MurR/RpiR family transcriptional regulator n=1 Tax=Rhodomicrobium TaxID=1068 RepID=UPI000B4BCBF1|nr:MULTISPECIES: MurR/RpiR family transcriptional regulator [Rhodomicrobium]
MAGSDGGGRENTAAAIARIWPNLTAQEARAAAHLRQHYPAAGLGPMARFAREAGVSPQTVLRLLSKLDVESWEAFQERLRLELAAEPVSPLGRWSAQRLASIEGADWLGSFAGRLSRNVAETFAGLRPAEFEAAALAVADPKRHVLVIGGRFTQQLARLLARHLQIVRGGVEEIGSLSSTWPDRLIDVGRKTVVVAFDIRRYSSDVVRFTQLSREQGACVVLFTDAPNAPAVEHAQNVFIGAVESGGAWDSITALLGVTEALVARVTELSGLDTADRMGRLETLRRRLFDEGGRTP